MCVCVREKEKKNHCHLYAGVQNDSRHMPYFLNLFVIIERLSLLANQFKIYRLRLYAHTPKKYYATQIMSNIVNSSTDVEDSFIFKHFN